jgi:predicted permease
MEKLVQDLVYGLRMLRKTPGFTAVAVLTLALGIGANTALFSIVNGVLLNPLPFPDPDQLVTLHESKPNFEQGSISYPNFRDWQKENRSFSSLAISRSTAFTLTGVGEGEQVNGQFVSSDFFPILGVKPLMGRLFGPGEDEIGAAPNVLISEGLWKRKLSGTGDVLGKTLTLDGKIYTVIGVVPASFHLRVSNFTDSEVYAPIGQWGNPLLTHRGSGLGIHGLGRLKPGVSLEQAQADMEAVSRSLAAAYADDDKGISAKLVPMKSAMVHNVQKFLLVLLTAVGFVLLIACVNVANLLLARSTGRSREMAIRTALGASRSRVIRQLLVESLLLAIAGGGLGLFLAGVATRTAVKMLPTNLPRAEEIGLDLRVLIFTLAISLLSGVLFGLAPALKLSHPLLHDALKEGGRGLSGVRHRAQSIFVVTEIALALVLLVGAGLMVRSLARLWSVDPGFNTRNVLTFGLSLRPSLANASPEEIRAAFREVDRNLESTPGVDAASLSWGALPMNGDDEMLFWMSGQPKPSSLNEMNWALRYVVDPAYLKAMGLRLIRGRFLEPHDNENAPAVVVVDDAFAAKYFGANDPLGQRINVDEGSNPAQIVGIVQHVKQWGLEADDKQSLKAQAYLPFMQLPDKAMKLTPSGVNVVAHFSSAPALASGFDALRATLHRADSQHVVYTPQTMDEIISFSLGTQRFAMMLLAAFSGMALLLASMGIYGVISYIVGQRTHEIGVRMALGARRWDVLRLVLSSGGRLALIGAGVGLVAALGLTRLMQGVIYGVSANDPLTFAAVSVLLVLVALVACFGPAKRASDVDPMIALRYE